MIEPREPDALSEAIGLLPDWLIEAAVDRGEIKIEPFFVENIEPASLDLTLGPEFLIPHAYRSGRPRNSADGPDSTLIVDPVNMGTEPMWSPLLAPTSYTLRPGHFVLASTRETITLGRQYSGELRGKSSWARLGLQVHITAAWIDPGFSGTITLELVNQGPWLLRLRPGMKVGQLAVYRMSHPCQRPYGASGRRSHYQGSTGPVPSRVFEGFSCDDPRSTGRSVL